MGFYGEYPFEDQPRLITCSGEGPGLVVRVVRDRGVPDPVRGLQAGGTLAVGRRPRGRGGALYNLVGNAVKFSPAERSVTVGLELADGGRKLLFSIADEGPGIPEEEQRHVFSKYYRGSRTKRTTDGIGLGLSIAKSIVEAHGGNIWLSSLPGKGCTFYFTIPVDGARD